MFFMISTFLFQEVKKNAIRIHFLFCYTTIKKLQGKHKNANVRHKYYTEKNSSMIEKKNSHPPKQKLPPKKRMFYWKKKQSYILPKKRYFNLKNTRIWVP